MLLYIIVLIISIILIGLGVKYILSDNSILISDNEKKRQLYIIGMIISGIIAGVSIAFFFFTFFKGGQIVQYFGNSETFSNAFFEQKRRIPVLRIMMFLSIVCLGFFRFFYAQFKKINAGIRGERKTQKILSGLPSKYQILSNISIEYDGKKSEIDSLILSSKGIVIVETKSYKGLLEGTEDDLEWKFTKTSAKGNKYTSTIRNPLKQVKRQTFILSNILKENGIHCWINSYVFFSEGQCHVSSENIFMDERSLVNRVILSGKDNALSDVDIIKIKSILKKQQ